MMRGAELRLAGRGVLEGSNYYGEGRPEKIMGVEVCVALGCGVMMWQFRVCWWL